MMVAPQATIVRFDLVGKHMKVEEPSFGQGCVMEQKVISRGCRVLMTMMTLRTATGHLSRVERHLRKDNSNDIWVNVVGKGGW